MARSESWAAMNYVFQSDVTVFSGNVQVKERWQDASKKIHQVLNKQWVSLLHPAFSCCCVVHAVFRLLQ